MTEFIKYNMSGWSYADSNANNGCRQDGFNESIPVAPAYIPEAEKWTKPSLAWMRNFAPRVGKSLISQDPNPPKIKPIRPYTEDDLFKRDMNDNYTLRYWGEYIC